MSEYIVPAKESTDEGGQPAFFIGLSTLALAVLLAVTAVVQPAPRNALAQSACMNITGATVASDRITYRVSNPQAAAVSLTSASLTWPSGVLAGRYVDWFNFAGRRFYNGNSAASPVSAAATPPIALASGASADFIVRFGGGSLPPGGFTITLYFTGGCTASYTAAVTPTPTRTITPTRTSRWTATPTRTRTNTPTASYTSTITFTRTPSNTPLPSRTRTNTRTPTNTRTFTPGTCAYVNSAVVGANYISVSVRNNSGGILRLTNASVSWPANGTRYVDYFQFGTSRFYNGNSYTSPTSASAPSVAFNPGTNAAFRVQFGNPGVFGGTFGINLTFSPGCSLSYTFSGGVTPTFTPTTTFTRTATNTPVPIVGRVYTKYSSLLLNAGDITNLEGQTLTIEVSGDIGGMYPQIILHVISPTSGELFIPTFNNSTGSFVFRPSDYGDANFGCNAVGTWSAYVEVYGLSGQHYIGPSIIWLVSYPQVHQSP